MSTLKLFVWENVFENYLPGIMFAYAESLEAARQLLIDEHMQGYKNFDDHLGYWDNHGEYVTIKDNRMKEVLSELNKPHIVYETPVAYIQPGSD
jgi:hypothetical protein